MLAWWPLTHGWPTHGPTWAWLMGLGVIHTGLAYVVLYAGMARLGTGRIALLQFVYPAAAVVVDWLVYGRALSALQGIGVIAMAAALLAVRPR
jgi:drug/metabolite transporter (DMT)-like permease